MAIENSPKVGKEKEPWDYREFVRLYNEISDQYQGWEYVEDEITHDLPTFYQKSSAQTLREYAYTRFLMDQRSK